MTSNLPFSEGLARDVLVALKEGGFFYRADFDPKATPLEQIIAPPNARHGLRIYSITEGPGKHKAEMRMASVPMPAGEYEVPQGQVYATIDTIATIAGECSTYAFERQEDGTLKMIERYVHMRS